MVNIVGPSPEDIARCILNGNAEGAQSLARASLQAGLEPVEAIEPFVQAIRRAGDLFAEGEFFLPQLLLAAGAMQAALGIFFPESGDDPDHHSLSRGTVVAGTVQGDIHEIGKNLVCALLSAHGFRVIDLGADVPHEKFLEATRQQKPDFLVLSALLTTTMIQQRNLIVRLVEQGLRDSVKVLVGGAPVTAQWARDIGADGYAPDAARAVKLAFHLLEESGD